MIELFYFQKYFFGYIDAIQLFSFKNFHKGLIAMDWQFSLWLFLRAQIWNLIQNENVIFSRQVPFVVLFFALNFEIGSLVNIIIPTLAIVEKSLGHLGTLIQICIGHSEIGKSISQLYQSIQVAHLMTTDLRFENHGRLGFIFHRIVYHKSMIILLLILFKWNSLHCLDYRSQLSCCIYLLLYLHLISIAEIRCINDIS